MRLLFFILTCIALLFFAESCKKKECFDPANPECENYDPCFGKEPVKAKMLIAQYFDFSSHPDMRGVSIEEEKLLPGYIKFGCQTSGVKKCTWILGAETLIGPEIKRLFDISLPQETYTVTLIVEKDPSADCFPADDGIDTLTKKFKLVNTCDILMRGRFKGVWEGETDSTILSLRFFDPSKPSDTCYAAGDCRIINLKKQNDTIILSRSDMYLSNSTLAVRAGSSLIVSRLDMKVNPVTMATELQYQVGGTGSFKKFNGRRIAD